MTTEEAFKELLLEVEDLFSTDLLPKDCDLYRKLKKFKRVRGALLKPKKGAAK